MTKAEIDAELEDKGDFVQIDYLTNYLGIAPSISMKKFAYLKLAKVYENKKMFLDAARAYDNAALNSLSAEEKMNYYVMSAKKYIKAGLFEKVDDAIKKAMGETNVSRRAEIAFEIKEYYKRQAELFEFDNKRNSAAKIYEKLLSMDLRHREKLEIKKKLLGLYTKLGRFKDHANLRKLGDDIGG